jgi:hypothetical protein
MANPGPCQRNRRGQPHVKQPNKRELRRQRAAERTAEHALMSEGEKRAYSLRCRDGYCRRAA